MRTRAGRITIAMILLAAIGCTSSGDPTSADAEDADTPKADSTALASLHADADTERGGRIVDEHGREVLLRGVNVNSLGEYWEGNEFEPVFPFEEGDPQVIADMGWNVVRLVLSWSRVEPSPGDYDETYLDRVDDTVRALAAQDVYTIIDMHQDAWSATLATRPGETCEPPLERSLGWDGAPEWATLDGGEPHCQRGLREGNLAAVAAWDAFFEDREGPGGVGIQTRFVAMWRHVAERFATDPAVAAFEILNEPNAFTEEHQAALGELYERTFQAIREGERAVDGSIEHIVMFEPSAIFSVAGDATPPVFNHDGNVAYAPHVYTGTFPVKTPPEERWFASAETHAAELGGVPVVNGEWGGRPRSRETIDRGFYNTYQALQDQYGFSGQFWLYKSSCGDPHEIDQDAEYAAGLYIVDCDTNEVVGMREDLIEVLARPYPRAVAGAVDAFSFDPGADRFELSYRPLAESARTTEVAVPPYRYPDGYRAEVTGGTVVSEPGSEILAVESCPGTETVTVVVTTGGDLSGTDC